MTDPQNPQVPDAGNPVPPPAYTPPPAAAAPAAGPYSSAPPANPTVPGKTLGIVALIVAIFANVIGLILGIVALVQSRKAGYKNGPAVAAIIVGAVLFVIGIIVTIIVVGALIAAGGFASEALRACEAVGYSGVVTVQGVAVDCATIQTTP